MDTRKFLKTVEAMHAYQKVAIKEYGMIFSISVSSTQMHVHIGVGRFCLTRVLYASAPFSEATKLLHLVEGFLARYKPDVVSAITVDMALCSNRNCDKRARCQRHLYFEEMLVGRLSQNNRVEHYRNYNKQGCKYFIPKGYEK